MNKLMIGFIVLFFVIISATTLFAGKRIDYGWSSDLYKYDIISGEVTHIDHDSSAMKIDDQHVFFTDQTKFYGGNIDSDMESVYGGTKMNERDRVMAKKIEKGKLMKCRYERDENGRLFLHTCLIEK